MSRILVVEDETDLLGPLSQALREAGYAVDEAADGHSGLSRAVAAEYDAIVLDLMLPRMDGFSVLRNLRQSRTTPVLMLTCSLKGYRNFGGAARKPMTSRCWPSDGLGVAPKIFRPPPQHAGRNLIRI